MSPAGRAVAAAALLRRRPASARAAVEDGWASSARRSVASAGPGGRPHQQQQAAHQPAAAAAAPPSPPTLPAALFPRPASASSLLRPHVPPCPVHPPSWRGAGGPWAALGGRAYLSSPAAPPPPVPIPRPGWGRLVPHPEDDAAGPVECVGMSSRSAALVVLPAPLLPPLVLGGGPAGARGLSTSALVAGPPPPPPPPGGGTPTPQAPPPADATAAAGPTADLCDFAISELDDTKSRVESAKAAAAREQAEAASARPASTYKPATLGSRLAGAASATAAGLATAGRFVAAAPGKVYGFFAHTTRAERRATYAGWWAAAKAEARHYWAGLKLLGADVRIAARLVRAAASGRALTRRERRQLTRTVADVFRLVPVAVFLVVPFMEFLLPVALKLFPNMLPSTFETQLQREEALKRRVQAKLEVARFLQDTVAEMARGMRTSGSGTTAASAADLYAFMKRVRAGEAVSAYEVTRFAALFSDELTLDNLPRVQLASLCRFVGIQPFGTDAFLAARLRAHLARIKADDRAIKEEGLDSLTDEELRSACRARGMRAPFGEGARAAMVKQLEEWLDLSLNRALPSSLLLLSRAFTVTGPLVLPTPPTEAAVESVAAAAAAAAAAATPAAPAAAATPSALPAMEPAPAVAAVAAATTTAAAAAAAAAAASTPAAVERLKETLGVLPDEVIEAASLDAPPSPAEEDTAAGRAAALERRLEALRREEELIAEEAEEAAEGADAAAAALAEAEDAKARAAAAAAAAPALTPGTGRLLPAAQQAVAATAAAAVVREAAAAAAVDALATPTPTTPPLPPTPVTPPTPTPPPKPTPPANEPISLPPVPGESAEERAAREAAAKEERMRKVISALAVLASTSGVSAERADFMNLVRVEIDRLNDELAASRGGAAKLVFSSSGTARSLRPPVEPLKKALGAERLADRVPAILTRIERELDAVDARIGEKMHVLDTDGDGVVTEGELRAALGFLRDNLGDGELRALLERLEGLRAEAGAAAGDGRGAPGDVIDVAKLMELARSDAEARAAKSSLTPPT